MFRQNLFEYIDLDAIKCFFEIMRLTEGRSEQYVVFTPRYPSTIPYTNKRGTCSLSPEVSSMQRNSKSRILHLVVVGSVAGCAEEQDRVDES